MRRRVLGGGGGKAGGVSTGKGGREAPDQGEVGVGEAGTASGSM